MFSWNLLSNAAARCEHRTPTRVSILVFVELALELGFDRASAEEDLRFNPCFRGTCSRTPFLETMLRFLFRFQSLFSWNLLSNSAPAEVISLKTCFNPCFRGTCSRTENFVLGICLGPRSFNPCFRGTCSRTVRVAFFCSMGFGVSILVFVELALELHVVATFELTSRVSILVFVELALEQEKVYEGQIRITEFQSLFSWNLLSNKILIF